MNRKLASSVVDLLCLLSIVGIWPRFIEPKRLLKTSLKLPLGSKNLEGLKILHLTDLHFHAGTSARFLKKVAKAIAQEKPDLILFTGDFICYSRLEEKSRLKAFLQHLKAPLGTFCSLGNHDYASYVSRNGAGSYSILSPANPLSGLWRGFRTFFEKTKIGNVSEEAKKVPLHTELCDLLKEMNITLLHNSCHTLAPGLNLVGLGDYALGRCLPEIAFAAYEKKYPGIVLSHNPDTLDKLLPFPGDLILSGHTHGEQIHFPAPAFMRRLSQKLTRLENPLHSRGLFTFGKKKLYVNRGLGCHKPIRLFSPPEILVMTIAGVA